ncbi:MULTISPECIES: hypothetical protein [unclassified Methanosarcina]|uniref:hypothetical protein n=1 Tax=unclassified Methanosarcina TaxID=2644672 RepID=UPI00064E7DCE|nr:MULTISPECIES: hypothetical protein [unclassified Methanosarcina]
MECGRFREAGKKKGKLFDTVWNKERFLYPTLFGFVFAIIDILVSMAMHLSNIHVAFPFAIPVPLLRTSHTGPAPHTTGKMECMIVRLLEMLGASVFLLLNVPGPFRYTIPCYPTPPAWFSHFGLW